MKILRIIALFFCIASLAAVAVCIFTDWNDGLYVLLALVLSIGGNAVNILSDLRGKDGKENKR